MCIVMNYTKIVVIKIYLLSNAAVGSSDSLLN